MSLDVKSLVISRGKCYQSACRSFSLRVPPLLRPLKNRRTSFSSAPALSIISRTSKVFCVGKFYKLSSDVFSSEERKFVFFCSKMKPVTSQVVSNTKPREKVRFFFFFLMKIRSSDVPDVLAT